MFIGYFTERPYQDPNSGYFGATGRPITDLKLSNADYAPELNASHEELRHGSSPVVTLRAAQGHALSAAKGLDR